MALLPLRHKEVPTVDQLHTPKPCHLRMLYKCSMGGSWLFSLLNLIGQKSALTDIVNADWLIILRTGILILRIAYMVPDTVR